MSQSSARKFAQGQLNQIDDLEPFADHLAGAIKSYCQSINNNRQSYKWVQAIQWIENILFGLGRQYIDDLLVARIARDTDGNLSVNRDYAKRVPKPVNDFIGRYVETNISLLTENRPQPRITAKSDAWDDKRKAELSQLVIEYLWEELGLPEKHREIARILMYCGMCFLETAYDPTEPRHLAVQETKTEGQMTIPGPDGTPIALPIDKQVGVVDERGAPVYKAKVEYGDITCRVVSPFELHFPQVHWWEDVDWVIKETYVPISTLQDRYGVPELKKILTKKNGWDLSALDHTATENVQSLPLWWWERMTNVIEGPGPSIYVGTPEMWNDYVVVRTLDRKPNPKWPKGRTVIVVGDKVLYDSPKLNGGRVYDPRWPHRWHPYTRFRWEAQCGSILGRSLVSKLLPKIKRINAIDTTLIMWRRTVPIATWIMPRGTSPIEDLHCLPAYATIVAHNGVKQIRDIKVGDKVLSKDGYTDVLAVHQNGFKDQFVSINAYGHSSIKLTPNHIIPIKRNESFIEVPAKEIQKGDYLIRYVQRDRTGTKSIDLVDLIGAEEIRGRTGYRTRQYDQHLGKGGVSNLPIKSTIDLDEDFLWLLGIYAAEGCTSRGRAVFSLGYHETYLEDRIVQIVRKKFGIEPSITIKPEKGVRVVNINNTVFQKMIKALVPGTAKTKSLSSELFTSQVSLLPLVSGWLDGDGSAGTYKNCRNFGGTTASASLALQLNQIILDEGILSKCYRTERRFTDGKIGTYWLINLSDDCDSISDKSVRFIGQVGPKRKHLSDAIYDNDKWLFKITRQPNIKIGELEPVYDLTTTAGYYNYRGFAVHNSGRPGAYIEYDPRKTNGMAPTPVHPPSYPEAALIERDTCKQEMEAIAGTEDVLRGQRPTGVNCWVEGSKLTDSNGQPVEVKDIKINDKHMSLTGEGPIGFTHTATYVGDVKTLHSVGNLPVTVTPNHAFPVLPREALPRRADGKRKQIKHSTVVPPLPGQITKRTANEIKVGDFLLSGFNRPKDKPAINADLLWLYGIYLAEGYTSFDNKMNRPKTVSWTLNVKEVDTAYKIRDIIKTQFNYDVKFQTITDRNALYVHCHSTKIAKHFISLFNTGSATKAISEEVFRSESNLLPLVAGWMDGDGNHDGNTYRGSTVSESMASQLRAICLDAQVYTTISKAAPRVSGKFIGRHSQFTLRISGADAKKVNAFAVKRLEFSDNKHSRGRRGFWYEGYYASRVSKIYTTAYDGNIYNVTMNDFTGCDNSVNAFGLYTQNSAAMLDVLRKQALSSRSAILQAWDESLQHVGTSILQEVIKHVKADARYEERLKILSREKSSRFTIRSFTGADLSDNVIVRVDTASMAMVSKEAKQARAIEILQYGPGLANMPLTLQKKLMDELGFPDSMSPKSPDIQRAQILLSFVKNSHFDLAIPFPEDDPYVIHEFLVEDMKAEAFMDYPQEQQIKIVELMEYYKGEIERIERAQLQMQFQLAQATNEAQGGQPQ